MSSLHELIMGNAFKAFIDNAQRETTNMQDLALYSAKLAQDKIAEEQKAEQKVRDQKKYNDELLKMPVPENSDSETIYSIGEGGIEVKRTIKPIDSESPFKSIKDKADLANKLAIADPMFAGRLAKEVAEEYDYMVSGIDGAKELISGPMQPETIPLNTPIKSASDLPLETTIAMPKAPGAGMQYGPAVEGRMEGIKAVEKEKPAAKAKVEETAQSMDRFFYDTNRAFNELSSKVPNAGASTLSGWLERSTTVPIKKGMGQLPNTKAMSDRISKFVYPMAKSYDPGGRLAKDDIQAFANVLGMVGSESSADIAVKGALELRDLVETMNKKGADGDSFVSDFLSKSESEGGMFKLIADEYKQLAPAKTKINDSSMDDDTAFQVYQQALTGE